jgi:hypothetical protein
MKYWILFLSFWVWNYLSYSSSLEEKPKDDAEFFLRMVKEDQLEKKLRSSQVFKDCIKKTPDETSKCFGDKIKSLEKGQAEKLIENLELGKVELYGDPNQANLSKYLTGVVEKALYGDAAKVPGSLDYLNQETFLLVYERIVGKALFFELADYCLKYHITNNGNNNNKDLTLKNVADTFVDFDTTEKNVKQCVTEIRDACTSDVKSDPKKAEACLFNRRLIEFKTVLNKIKTDKAEWENIKKNSTTAFEVTHLDKRSAKNKSAGMIASELTNISSSKLVDEGYGENQGRLTKQAEEMGKECAKNPNDQACKKFFNKGTTESLGQYRLQKELEIDLKLKTLEDSSEGKLKIIAKESNFFSEKEIKDLENMSDSEIKDKLSKKYLAEKESIKKIIDEKIKTIGISREQDLKNATQQLGEIEKLLKNKPEELRAINFFSNAIVATFSFKNDPEKKRRVLSGIDTELKDLKDENGLKYLESMKKDVGRSTASEDENHFLEPEEIDNLLFGTN